MLRLMRAQRAQSCRDLDQWLRGADICREGVVRGSGYCLYRYWHNQGKVRVTLHLVRSIQLNEDAQKRQIQFTYRTELCVYSEDLHSDCSVGLFGPHCGNCIR